MSALPAVAAVLAAGAVLVLADAVLDPVPLGALLACAAAFAGRALGGHRALAWALAGFVVALVVDGARHRVVHRSGPSPAEGLAPHLAVDLAVAAATAGLALGVAWVAARAFAGGEGAG